MHRLFYLDASVLVKRYVPEAGTPVVNHLFGRVPRSGMVCLTLGGLEVVSILVRKRNANVVSAVAFNQAMTDFRSDILDEADVAKVTATDVLVNAAFPLVQAHSINANDAVLLRSALDLADALRDVAKDLVLVTSDRRLSRAAAAEGLTTFDPETQTQAELDALLGP